MFSMLPTPAHTHLRSHHHTPAVSSPLSSSPLRASPLSPRDTNTLILTPTRDFDPMISPTPTSKSTTTPATTRSPSTNPSASTRGGSSGESTFSKRATKPNPLLQKSNTEGRETRRKLFLKKVKEGSEDKRWKARGGEEEMMRTIWVMEERRRIARLREFGGGEQEMDEGDYLSLDEVMVEDLVEREEEAELDAIVASMGEQMEDSAGMDSLLWEQSNMQQSEYIQTETPYGSDDDEYDDIFMDVMREESRQASQQQPSLAEADTDQDMMDMS